MCSLLTELTGRHSGASSDSESIVETYSQNQSHRDGTLARNHSKRGVGTQILSSFTKAPKPSQRAFSHLVFSTEGRVSDSRVLCFSVAKIKRVVLVIIGYKGVPGDSTCKDQHNIRQSVFSISADEVRSLVQELRKRLLRAGSSQRHWLVKRGIGHG